MGTAQQILLGYGVIVLAYGLLLGIPLAAARSKAAAASRHLVNAHLSGLIQGGVVLGLGGAFGATGFESGLATVGALLIVAGFAAESIGGTLNWLQSTGDQFAERSPGFLVNSLSGLLAVPGVLICVYGILTGL
ncbi:MAG: hypothetical protein ACRBK7_03495 [Acidimicrobiales bacterium]